MTAELSLDRDLGQLATAFGSFDEASRELDSAYAALDAQLGEIEVAAMLDRSDRLAALGEMVATLAHQIRTPLSSALLYASNARLPGLGTERRCELIDKSIGCLHTLEALISDMLRFARGDDAIRSGRFTLRELLADVDTATRPLLVGEQFIEYPAADDSIELCGNRATLAGAIQNLIVNALQAAGRRAHIQIDAAADRPAAGSLSLSIRDNGPGIAAADAERIFEPFHTGRANGNGLGLGVARSVIRAHRGELKLEQLAGAGACFVIGLPLAADSGPVALEQSA